MTKKITFKYGDTYHTLNFKEIHAFLAKKPVDKHFTDDYIRKNIKGMEKSGKSIRQCLGIDHCEVETAEKGNSKPCSSIKFVSKRDLPHVLLVNSFLRKGLGVQSCE